MKIWIYVALILLAVIIALQNAGSVDLRLLFWKVPISLIVVVLLPLGVGFLAGFGIGRFRQRRPGTES